jgi:hypothetical protein
MPQTALAELAGVAQTVVSLAERGWASRRTLERLASVLGVDDPQSLLDLLDLGVTSSTPPPTDPPSRDAFREEEK